MRSLIVRPGPRTTGLVLALGAAALPASGASEVLLDPAWQAPLGDVRGRLISAAVAGELLVVEDERGGATALRLADGTPAWFVELGGGLSRSPAPGDGVVVLVSGTRVLVIDQRTGARRFDENVPDVMAVGPTADRDHLLFPSLMDDRLVAIDLGSGLTTWSYQLRAPFSGALERTPDGQILVSTEDGWLRALPFAGPEHWSVRTGRILGRPVVAGKVAYAATHEPSVYAIDAGAGTILWKHLPGERLRGLPVRAGERVIVAAESRLLALDAATGREVWTGPALESPLGSVGDLVLLRQGPGASLLRDAATGAIVADGLPGRLFPCGDLAVEIRDERLVVASRAVRVGGG